MTSENPTMNTDCISITFEYINGDSLDHYRIIFFERDIDTGAKHVLDILEIDGDTSHIDESLLIFSVAERSIHKCNVHKGYLNITCPVTDEVYNLVAGTNPQHLMVDIYAIMNGKPPIFLKAPDMEAIGVPFA